MAIHTPESVGVSTEQSTQERKGVIKRLRRSRLGRTIGAGVLTLGLTTGTVATTHAFDAESYPATNRGVPKSAKADPATGEIAPFVQAAEAGALAQLIIDYVTAVDQAKKQQELADYLTAVAAKEVADAQSKQTINNIPVHYNSNPGDFLACVRQRESRGDYTIHNLQGSGASGAYQFMPGTWNSIAASSGRPDLVGLDPAAVAPADQDAMAIALYASQGAAPWGGSC